MKHKQIVYMTKGLPASGKTTLAKNMVIDSGGLLKRVNKDDIRAMSDASIWSKDREKYTLKTRDMLIRLALEGGFDVISDDTNFGPHEERLRQLARDNGAEFQLLDLTNVSLEECLARDRKRTNYVGEKVIRDMYNKYLRPSSTPLKQFNLSLPPAVICDLDGTLCIHNGRSPYDYSKVLSDIRSEEIYSILVNNKAPVIFVSGRPESDGAKAPNVRKDTEAWLRQNTIFDGIKRELTLFMRPAGDKRKDFIVKREIYQREIEGKYNVLFVLDDRNQTVEEWRRLGLKCLQVADGAF